MSVLRPYLVTFDNGQHYLFQAEDWEHAKSQGEDAEPDLELVAVSYITPIWDKDGINFTEMKLNNPNASWNLPK